MGAPLSATHWIPMARRLVRVIASKAGDPSKILSYLYCLDKLTSFTCPPPKLAHAGALAGSFIYSRCLSGPKQVDRQHTQIYLGADRCFGPSVTVKGNSVSWM